MLLSVMVYVHHFFDATYSNCLAPFVNQWPRNGVLRIEVIRNLKKFNAYQDRLLGKFCDVFSEKFFKCIQLNLGYLTYLIRLMAINVANLYFFY